MLDEINLLKGLVSVYSPSQQEEGAVHFLVSQMINAGFQTEIDVAGNAIGSRGSGSREIMLLGHIDTVPGEIPVRIDGGLLFGRGTVDAKGPLACFTAAAARLNPPEGWKITVIGAVGEESASHGAYHLRETRDRPEALIIGEPSKWDRITLGFKGSLTVGYTYQQPSAHSAGKNGTASEEAIRFWNEVVAWCSKVNQDSSTNYSMLSPTLHSIHSSTDGFKDLVKMRIQFRLPPSLQPQDIYARLDQLKGEAILTHDEGIPAYKADKNNPLVRAFLSAIRQHGGVPNFSTKSGTSDMNIVAPLWQCPAIAYGPGDSSLDHTPNEHISLTEYLKSIDVLSAALTQYWSQASTATP